MACCTTHSSAYPDRHLPTVCLVTDRFSECDRGMMLIHFRALTERIYQLEAVAGSASSTQRELRTKLESEQATQADIVEYLRGEIHNKNSQINELQEK